MAKILEGFHALITGSSEGLGLSMARALLLNGASVAISSRPSAKLDRIVDILQNEGLDAYKVPMDVRDEKSVNNAVKWVQKNWGQLDLLVNNAGLGNGRVNEDFIEHPKLFFEIDAEGFRDVVDTNLTGYFLVAKAFAPMMIEKKEGRIVNISTSLSTMRMSNMTPYGPSRAASEALSAIMSVELAEYGIDVNILLPGGAAETNLFTPKALIDFKNKKLPLLDANIMSEPILFLASPQAKGMTGERIIAKQFREWLSTKDISFQME